MDQNWASERARMLREILGGRSGSVRRGGLKHGPKRRGDKDGGEPVPADPGPRPLPLEGGAEAPLD